SQTPIAEPPRSRPAAASPVGQGEVFGSRPARHSGRGPRPAAPAMQVPPGDSLQPEAIGAVMEATKWLKPSISVSRIGDSASVQAATRVNAEQASKRSMRRPTRRLFRGCSMYTRKARATREAPMRDQG